jgi:hypothetical protein
MEITAKETKRIERLRNQLRLWPRTRWIVAFNGVLLAVLCTCSMSFVVGQLQEQQTLVHRLFSTKENISAEHSQSEVQSLAGSISVAIDEQDNLVLFSVFICVWMVSALLSIWHFATLIRDWHGNTEKTLLLKLYDEAVGRQTEAKRGN